MSEEQRRFAAIMLTDIVGYTAMTQKNESLALQLLQSHNELLRPVFPQHLGREIKTIGDAFLVEFDSASDAFLCAVEIQDLLHKYNKTIPSKDMQYPDSDWTSLWRGRAPGKRRVWKRREHLCENSTTCAPGGICVSEQVYEKVLDKSPYQFKKLPTPELKNVLNPVEVYLVLLPWLSDTSQDKPKEKNSIPSIKQRLAVLPLIEHR